MNSAFYEHGEGTAAHLVIILAVGFELLLSPYITPAQVYGIDTLMVLLFPSAVAEAWL